jgi:hypothetical protein
MPEMRQAQTANYGTCPNEAMPNTFLAQAYDLDDPWGDKSCYGYACCRFATWYNFTTCNRSTYASGIPATPTSNICDDYCVALEGTAVYMGGIHPRNKQPVGSRLAIAAHAIVYNGTGPSAGPTIESCVMASPSSFSSSMLASATSDGTDGITTDNVSASVTVVFSAKQLGSESVLVKDYNRSTKNNPIGGLSAFQVLTNSSWFCPEPIMHGGGPAGIWWCPQGGKDGYPVTAWGTYWGTGSRAGGMGDPCPSVCERCNCPKNELSAAWLESAHDTDDSSADQRRDLSAPPLTGYHQGNLTGRPPGNPFELSWVTVPIDMVEADSLKLSVVADLSSVKGAPPVGVRYAW